MLLFAYAKTSQSQRNDEQIVVVNDCGSRRERNPRIARLLRLS